MKDEVFEVDSFTQTFFNLEAKVNITKQQSSSEPGLTERSFHFSPAKFFLFT